ncbi:SDR family oxidoreductase [Enterovibrio sp. ZSDZ35]|uniref:SDR family oxidoreductase n=1 Tax=Enterovibrio qingdaonensis TaxID=2899818 RepID=A0ABT5QGS4_9GAMM|nr:SDR family oxidoreductase [Enterovibrio sp. ZSDZ35]MDD1780175.1 SDR family oxidoreductase [Enterovibrio sp. ZSDZ35]
MNHVLVTGAGRGIGLEMVKQLLKRGDFVLATFRGTEPPPSLLSLACANLEFHPLRVTHAKDIETLAETLEGRTIDLLINNAGIIGPKHQAYNDMDVSGWLETFEINTIAPLMITTALIPNLTLSSNPRVITISSQMGALNRDAKGMLAYRSSKAAVNKVMQVLSLELKEQGITVCPVHPGWVKTDMGGDKADITTQESADGILALADRLSIENSGTFFTWEGNFHEW